MPNSGQPTIQEGASGGVVRRLQRALRRTASHSVVVDGEFGPLTREAVIAFQEGSPPLAVDGIVGPQTWQALPDGGPMPLLREGSTGQVVTDLQKVLTDGAAGEWGVTPQGIDGEFGPHTKASVEAFQQWGGDAVDGIVGDQTWSTPMHAAGATLESVVGLKYVID